MKLPSSINRLYLALSLTIAATVVYFGSPSFRLYIASQNIDAEIIVGFISLYTLLFVLFQGRKERQFTYNLSVISKYEEMAVLLTTDLLVVQMHRGVYKATVLNVKECLASDADYKDSNDSHNLASHRNATAVAALDIYFPSQGENWNKMSDLIDEMGTLATRVLMNYELNDYSKGLNAFLMQMDEHSEKIQKIDKELGELPLTIRNNIIEELNSNKIKMLT